jgi:MFS family permease
VRPATKLALLTSLYFSQGLPFGFFTQALPVFLREEGMGLGAIGLTSMLALPWALKFLWAPAVDRYGSERFGRRKSWIVPLQLCAALLLGAIAFLEPSGADPWLFAEGFSAQTTTTLAFALVEADLLTKRR